MFLETSFTELFWSCKRPTVGNISWATTVLWDCMNWAQFVQHIPLLTISGLCKSVVLVGPALPSG